MHQFWSGAKKKGRGQLVVNFQYFKMVAGPSFIDKREVGEPLPPPPPPDQPLAMTKAI